MKGFEVGKRVRANHKVNGIDPGFNLKEGDIVTIIDLVECCGELAVYWGLMIHGSRATCYKCSGHLHNGLVLITSFFEPIYDDEIEIQSDTFKQITFTKIIENVPAGVN